MLDVSKNQSGEPPEITVESLTAQERRLVEVVRKLESGEVRVVVNDSEIVQIT